MVLFAEKYATSIFVPSGSDGMFSSVVVEAGCSGTDEVISSELVRELSGALDEVCSESVLLVVLKPSAEEVELDVELLLCPAPFEYMSDILLPPFD